MARDWNAAAGMLWPHLTAAAKRREKLTYGDAAVVVGTAARAVGKALDPIKHFCDGRYPPLTCIVVRAHPPRVPGPGCGLQAEGVPAAQEAVFAYDWHSVPNPFSSQPCSSQTPEVEPPNSPMAKSEIHPRVTPGDLAYACWAYETMTGYAGSWQDFRGAVGEAVDLGVAGHRDALFTWLNKWGCRIPAEGEAPVKLCLREWYERNGDRLMGETADLAEVSDGDLRETAALFDSLIDDMKRAATKRSLRFGPTAVSKTLFALRPRLFPAWDSAIRGALVNGEDSGKAYVRYAALVRNDIRVIARRGAELGIVGLPAALCPSRNATMAQLVGEYYWVTVTRKVKLPTLQCRRDWTAWSTVAVGRHPPDASC